MASPTDSTGRRIGRYRLLRHVASGGMAEIFLACHESPGGFTKELILKILQARYADNEQVIAMFLAEARLAAKLNHPNVVDVFDFGSDDGQHHIAMEYIHGKTLTDLVRRGIEASRPLSIAQAAHIVAETAAGLQHMHDARDAHGHPFGIVHRDISPSNLMISFAGTIKIIDFGIAHEESVVEEPGARPGKVSYMSPEQVQGHTLDGRSDIFSLGTILYEITLGRRLWRGPKESVMGRIVEESPPPPTYLQRDYPAALELIVMRAIEKRPDDRYQSASELFADLERFLLQTGLPPRRSHIAAYVTDLFEGDVEVSEVGLRRARAFVDDEGAQAVDPDALDFDRPAGGAGAALAQALRSSGPLVPQRPHAAVPADPSPPAPSAPDEPRADRESGPGRQRGVGRRRIGLWLGLLIACVVAAGLSWALA